MVNLVRQDIFLLSHLFLIKALAVEDYAADNKEAL